MALPKLENPTHSCVLPSTGVTVNYRPFLVGEQKVLMIAQESEDANAQVKEMIRLIDICCDDIDAKKLAGVDLEYLFIQMRIKSVGETSDVVVPCEKCNQDNEIKIDLESVMVNRPEPKVSNIIQITDNVSLDMQQPTYEVIQTMDANKAEDPHQIFDMVAKCIVKIIDGDEVHTRDDFTDKELMSFLDTMSIDMFEKIQLYFANAPSLEINHNYTCSNCEEQNFLELKGVANFFG
jgi:hypothetical protein